MFVCDLLNSFNRFSGITLYTIGFNVTNYCSKQIQIRFVFRFINSTVVPHFLFLGQPYIVDRIDCFKYYLKYFIYLTSNVFTF